MSLGPACDADFLAVSLQLTQQQQQPPPLGLVSQNHQALGFAARKTICHGVRSSDFSLVQLNVVLLRALLLPFLGQRL